jgi:ADP-heptose:LPS heptosyltransferase
MPRVSLVALQQGARREQMADVDFPLLKLAPRLDTGADAFVDTAAVLANLDLLVCTDTSIAHLADVLGSFS